MLDVIIKGGTVVAPEGAAVMDVGIQGEQIAVPRNFPITKILNSGRPDTSKYIFAGTTIRQAK